MNAVVCCCGWLCGVDVSSWRDTGEGSPQGLPGRGEVDVMGPPMVVTYRLQVIPPSYCVRKKSKETFTLFSDQNGSLLRRQPGVMTIGHSFTVLASAISYVCLCYHSLHQKLHHSLQSPELQHVVGQGCQRRNCLGVTDSSCAGLLDRRCKEICCSTIRSSRCFVHN